MMKPTANPKRRFSVSFRLFTSVVIYIFTFNLILPPSGMAQVSVITPVGGFTLPGPQALIKPTPAYMPTLLRAVKIFPGEPLKFEFIVDNGQSGLADDELKKESEKLIKYFLATLTVPKDELWVNLSPYEGDRIIPDKFGVTEMGRDLLAQDYILKQLTASLMYPEDELGQKFWERVYTKAQELYGTSEIPVNTFNKVWIVPHTARVYESGDMAMVEESYLKVMLEEDYEAMRYSEQWSGVSDQSLTADQSLNKLSTEHRPQITENNSTTEHRPQITEKNLTTDHRPLVTEITADRRTLATNIIREIIIPEIEREVNEGKSFAPLRQIYNSMILAIWYKRNLKASLLSRVYADENKVDGVDVEDKDVKNKIYQQYLEAFKKGVYDYIKEDYDPATQQIIERKYFSGGMPGAMTYDVLESARGTPQGMSNRLSGRKTGESSKLLVNLDPIPVEETRTGGEIDTSSSMGNGMFVDRKKSIVLTDLIFRKNEIEGEFISQGVKRRIKLSMTMDTEEKQEKGLTHIDSIIIDSVTNKRIGIKNFSINEREQKVISRNSMIDESQQKKGFAQMANSLVKMYLINNGYQDYTVSVGINERNPDRKRSYDAFFNIFTFKRLADFFEDDQWKFYEASIDYDDALMDFVKNAARKIESSSPMAPDKGQPRRAGEDDTSSSPMNAVGVDAAGSMEVSSYLKEQYGLSPREIEVAMVIAKEGLDSDELVSGLGITIHTVKQHVRHILEKMKVDSRAKIASIIHNFISEYEDLPVIQSSDLKNEISRRELEVLKLIAEEGYSNDEIAENLGISSYTVKAHVRQILTKMKVSNRVAAAAKYYEYRRAKKQQELQALSASTAGNGSGQSSSPMEEGVSKSGQDKNVGGIDLNPDLLDMQTDGQGLDFEIPVHLENLDPAAINGFTPVIYQIIPVTSFPALLGLRDDPAENEKADLLLDPLPADKKEHFSATEPARVSWLN